MPREEIVLGLVEAYDRGSRVELLERMRAGVVEARVAPPCGRLRAPNLDPRVVPIDVFPLQAADLARAQSAVEGECRIGGVLMVVG
jgi:hypothetical protein